MNKRIKRLVEDANLRHFINEDGSLTPELHYFAASIVRECAVVARSTDPSDGDDYRSGRYWAGIDIKKHFGVEE